MRKDKIKQKVNTNEEKGMLQPDALMLQPDALKILKEGIVEIIAMLLVASIFGGCIACMLISNDFSQLWSIAKYSITAICILGANCTKKIDTLMKMYKIC